ncbi:MAG: hypothetical protein ACE5OQ_16075 [Woeseia sp.]
MIARFIGPALAACLLVGCVSHEGTYSPSCIAYAGSNIELGDGEFLWEKFTDQVIVDDDGNVVDQFPGYPMRGTYRVEGVTVHMESASGDPMQDMYLHRHDGSYYLLTADQNTSWENTGEYAECALALNAQDAK